MGKIVLKFGGSSVADHQKIKHMADRILEIKKKYKDVVVVVSAMGDSTDHLLDLAGTISDNPDKREIDMLLSTGEQVSASLMAMALIEKGHKAISFTGFQAGFKTFGKHTKNKIDSVDLTRVEEKLNDGYIVIVTGFQGMNEKGDITTLGRGGSDTSAVAIAAMLKCDCEIYTDVAGIFTVDPRIYSKAKKLDFLTYEETKEMAYLGAKVLEPRSVELAAKYNVKLYVALNTGGVVGTYITKEGDLLEKDFLSNISVLDNVLLINFKVEKYSRETLHKIFKEISDNHVNLDIISQNSGKDENVSLAVSTTLDNKKSLAKVLDNLNLDYEFLDNVVKVSLIGTIMRNEVGIVSSAFKVFSKNNIKLHQVSSSEISLSFIVNSEDKIKLVELLAKEFNL